MTDNPKAPSAEDFKDLPLEELKAMQAKLENFVDRRMESKKKEALAQIKHLVKDHDLSLDEVTKALRTVAKRGKAVALFRNPDNPRQTWSGKGEAPDWYANHPNPDSLRID